VTGRAPGAPPAGGLAVVTDFSGPGPPGPLPDSPIAASAPGRGCEGACCLLCHLQRLHLRWRCSLLLELPGLRPV
jgi:hypothetical protein